MTDQDVLDFGSGYSGRWLGWSPDRDIPSNAERYAGIADIEKAMLLITCPHGDGGIHVDVPGVKEVFGDHVWHVESWDPLTISPSIHRLECGCHGFIREGKWVSA